MKEEKQQIVSKNRLMAISILVGLIGIAIVAWIQSEKAIKTQAIDGCLRLVSVETKVNDQTIRVPEQYWFNYCMQQKGYEIPSAKVEEKK